MKFYVCAWHRARGSTVCSNSFGRPVEAIDGAIVSWIRENVLQENVLVAAIETLRTRLTDRTVNMDAEVRSLQQEEARLKREAERLTAALATSDDAPEAVVKAIADRDRRLRAVRSQLDTLRAGPALIGAELNGLEAEARRRLADFHDLLRRHPTEARKVMVAVLDGPLTFTPVVQDGHRRFRIEGRCLGPGAAFLTVRDPSGIRTRVHALKGHCPGPG